MSRYLINRISERWYKLIWTLARSASVKTELGFDGARDYAEGEMGKEIRARVSKSLGLDIEEVETLWEKRFDHRGGPRADQYHYGVGSWVLGSEAIMRNTAQGKSENDSKAKQTKKDR